MKVEGLIVDTGALVAYLDPDEAQHAWAVAQFDANDGKAVTCEAVLAEALFLLRRHRPQLVALEEMLCDGIFDVSFSTATEGAAVVAHLRRYRNVPMSFADACLVRLSELYPRFAVITLDSDFRIYRRNRRQLIPLVAPARR